MSTTRRVEAMLLAFVGLTVACSQSARTGQADLSDAGVTTDAGPADGGTTLLGPRTIGSRVIDQREIDMYQGLCDWAARCNLFDVTFADPNECVNAFTTDTVAQFNSDLAVLASIREGKAVLDEELWATCLADMRQQSCGPEFRGVFALESCADAVAGRVEAGGRCISDLACGPGNTCELNLGSPGGPCSGVCLPSSHCHRPSDCSDGQACDHGKCVAPRPMGMEPGTACGTGLYCGPGLYCKGGYTCEQTPALGESCSLKQPSPPCRGEHVQCVRQGGSPSGLCMKQKSVGEACAAAYDCGDPTNTIMCDPTTHTCQRPPASGPCNSFGQCDPSVAYCQEYPEPPQCVRLAAVGEVCAGDASCGTFYPNAGVRCGKDPANPNRAICLEITAEVCVP